jgi:hypothetical protein
MKLTKTECFKFLFCPALFNLAIVLLRSSFRLTALVLLVALAISYLHFLRSSRTIWMRLMFVSFLIAVFLPIDVSLQNYPGPPRFVPLVMGLTNGDRASKGEMMLGGCMVKGTEPRWVWVW